MTQNRLTFLIILASFPVFLLAQTSVTFEEDFSVIPNPERGFYHHTEAYASNYSNLNTESLKGYRDNEGITQVLRVFYLQDFKEGSISTEYLNNLRKDFVAVRNAGSKIIVRFAYSKGVTAPYNDATPEIVQLHISQLRTVLNENADVIEVIQAGFIGTWGEWHFTDHFANSPGNIGTDDWENRRQVVYSLLDALPTDRMIQLRTPGYKMIVFGTENPLDVSNAFTDSQIARVGHHNDCFVASFNDQGTYGNNIEEQKKYLEQETYYVPMGGETCDLVLPYSNCDNSSLELERFHWSYLNKDYNREVLNEWDSQGCLDEVELRLGYRFRLIDGSFTSESKPGGKISFDLEMINDGYSNPYNPRLVEVILKHQTSGDEFFVDPDEKIKLWPINESFTISFEAGIPENAPEGQYDLYLNLPDPYLSLYNRPEYSIRVANTNTWDESLGYNDLNHTLSINAENGSLDYDGALYFGIKSAKAIIEIEGSNDIFGDSNSESILVYWGRQASGLNRVIERATNGEDFEVIVSTNADNDFYLDFNVLEGVNYTYRYYIEGSDSQSSPSSSIQLSLSESFFPTVTTDGNSEDWDAIAPLSTYTSELGDNYILRVFFDAKKANFLFHGKITDFQIFLDVDNDINSGFADVDSPLYGMDYQLTNNGLFEFSSGGWVKTDDEIILSSSENVTEFSLDHASFENLTSNRIIPIYTELNTQEIALKSQSGGSSFHYRSLPPDLPSDLDVRNSVAQPETLLILTWTRCNNCLGYNMERSIDGVNFNSLGTYASDIQLIRDDNLANETTYYYKMTTYNELGASDYSNIVSATTGETAEELSILQYNFSIFPNPVLDSFTIDIGQNEQMNLVIFDVSGNLVFSKLVTSGKEKYPFDVQNLNSGVYLVKINSLNKQYIGRLVKK